MKLPKAIHTVIQKAEALARLEIPVRAANASYFIILAAFPTLVLLLALLRYTSLDIQALLDLLSGILPDALIPTVEPLVVSTYKNASTALVSVSAVTALWAASRGIYGFITGLNAIYGVAENRGYIYTRLLSVVYTFLFLVVLVLTLVLHVFGTALLNLLHSSSIPLVHTLAELIDLRFFLLLFLQTAIFTAMFMVLPNRRNSLGDSLPGALLASIGWQLFSLGFSIYVEHFGNYANLYGSVAAVAIGMLWLYFCISILFYGGALNHYLIHDKEAKPCSDS